MAEQQHLDLLQQDSDIWNTWRKAHPDVQPDLNGADLKKARLGFADLSGANLSEAQLTFADLSKADLVGANLQFANLEECNLTGANLTNANLYGAHIEKAELSYANLTGAVLVGASLLDANLYNAKLINANLNAANFLLANLSKASLKKASLEDALFTDTNLTETDFSHASMGDTFFADVDLHTAKGLKTIWHITPSHISTSTLARSQGNIPETFLRGVGLDDTFIEYVHSLTNSPIRYYTCFISYSSRDQDFAERLYADLQSKGVRCWFAPHHMKTGDEIRSRIDESIRLYDKLLLILSRHSVRSEWVKKEVETAFAKERKQKKLMLFPVRLDETVTRTRQAWAADIQNTRHITDFSQWKEHDIYKQYFEKLLSDLQADETKKQP